MATSHIIKHYLGECCFQYSFGQSIDRELSLRILNLYHQFKQLDLSEWQVLDIVPSYTSLAFYLDVTSPLLNNSQLLDEKIHTLWQNPLAPHHATTHTIPTAYTGEDIEWVAKEHSLSVRELIQLHTAPTYLIAMLGFKPYFPYLIGLNQQLITPRRSSPRINTPHGSVAIGGAQTGIYTVDSPGGWHIIGQTSFRDFNQFKPGDFIIFQEI